MKYKRLAAAVLAAALWLTGCGGAAAPAAPAGSGAASQSAADTAVQTAQKDRITEQFTLEKTVRNEWGSAQKLTIHVPQLVCDSPDAESTYLLPWFKMTTWYFRLSRLLEVSNVKKRTKNHSADADRIFMLVKNHVLAVSGMGDEAPPTPGGRNGGSDVL